MKVTILASGRGTNARNILELQKNGNLPNVEIAAVISDKQDAPVLEVAKSYNVKSIYLDTMKSGAFFSKEGADFYIQNLQFVCTELVVMAGFMKILPDSILNAYKNRIINLHPSLLPAFKGKDAIGQAWNSGANESGCTVHFASAQLDGGEIIAQKKVSRLPSDTLETFEAKIHQAEYELLPRVISDIASGKIKIGV